MTRLTITPLGGLGETGALNCMLYESDDAAVLVDCGLGFADDRYPGAAQIALDFRDLEFCRGKLKALVLTHGHEDHLGGVARFRKLFDVPVYGSPFTLGVVRQKFSELNLPTRDLRQYRIGDTFDVGDLRVETIFVNHSIMDTAALLISRGGVRALHLTDFKIDHSGTEGRVIDLARFKHIGEEGLDLLLMDSTNVFGEGWTLSESVVRANLMEFFTRIEGRIIACLFSSNMFRIQSLVECARVTGRKVAFTGRSTKEYTRIARELDRLNLDGVELYDVEEVTKFPDSEILVLATGSQAEARSVLQRMSHGMFKPFKLREGDTLLMSSKMIPGNEGRILSMINRISLLGVDIVSEGMKPAIHSSGHARQDELREILRLTRPRHFIPIHGEHRHLKKHVALAVASGVPPERARVVLDGEVVELDRDGMRVTGQKTFGRYFLSEEGVEMSDEAVRRRRKIANGGLVGVAVMYDKLRGVAIADVALDSGALFGGEKQAEYDAELAARLNSALAGSPRTDIEKLRQLLKAETRQYFKGKFDIRPEVMVLVNEI